MRVRILSIAAVVLLVSPALGQGNWGFPGVACYPYAATSYAAGWSGWSSGGSGWAVSAYGWPSCGGCAGSVVAGWGAGSYRSPVYATPVRPAPAAPRMERVGTGPVPAPRLYAAPSAAPPSESAPPPRASGTPRGETPPPPPAAGSGKGAAGRSESAEPPVNLKPSAVESRPADKKPAAGVKVEVHKNMPLAFDAYFVGHRAAGKDRGKGTCSVKFWNLTDRDVTVAVEGKKYTVAAKDSVKLELGREFHWGVNDAEARPQRVPEEESGVEIVIRG